ncbi:hypothetical protein GL325_03545 [Aeromicrobium sp. 636]|uniref:Uncharacterized protein n=1 Tax=Aeromicrobium senzhongii TaxID=2663859 RepID=A0A8I0ESU1_9ACTN|nr:MULTISPECIES: hypothetical protein [Aeromicrobium]MBC9225389.1 hypothetical protein [Aeromicrobium senzhongii]MCQ3997499.1 hypothetical protein [Aeromicrobium sp. 636]
MTIAAHGHHHHFHVMTRYRGQVLCRAAVLLTASAATWVLPGREGAHGVDAPARWLGSAVTEAHPAVGVVVLLALVAAGYAWQRVRPADMGALAWVVAGGALAFVSLALVVTAGSGEGPVYWWLGVGVVVTSMTLQVLAALAGHGLAVLAARRREVPAV